MDGSVSPGWTEYVRGVAGAGCAGPGELIASTAFALTLGADVGSFAAAVGLAFAAAVGLAFGAGVAIGAALGLASGDWPALGAAVGLDPGVGCAPAFCCWPACFEATGAELDDSVARAGGPSTTPTTWGASGPSVKSHANGACGGSRAGELGA